MASSLAAPRAISVALETTPFSCSSAMARFTPRVSPKSSAFTISRRTAQSINSERSRWLWRRTRLAPVIALV